MTAILHIADDPFRVSVLLSTVYILALIICVTVFLLDRRRNHRLIRVWAGALVAETESFLARVSG
jgi:hypothetical protein